MRIITVIVYAGNPTKMARVWWRSAVCPQKSVTLTISEIIPIPRNKLWNFFNCTDTPNSWPKHHRSICAIEKVPKCISWFWYNFRNSESDTFFGTYCIGSNVLVYYSDHIIWTTNKELFPYLLLYIQNNVQWFLNRYRLYKCIWNMKYEFPYSLLNLVFLNKKLENGPLFKVNRNKEHT